MEGKKTEDNDTLRHVTKLKEGKEKESKGERRRVYIKENEESRKEYYREGRLEEKEW